MLKPGSFAHKVAVLDAALTGNRWREVEQMARQQARLLEDPTHFAAMSDAYYLSDGGYSRLIWVWQEEPERLGLSGVSRQEVKDAWPRCKGLIADVEDEIREAVE